jgi:hypothetical protein
MKKVGIIHEYIDTHRAAIVGEHAEQGGGSEKICA